MQEEFDVVLTKIKNKKATGLDEISWKTRKFDDILIQYSKAVYNQNTKDRWKKKAEFSLFSRKVT